MKRNNTCLSSFVSFCIWLGFAFSPAHAQTVATPESAGNPALSLASLQEKGRGNNPFFLENKGQVVNQYDQSRPDIDFRIDAGNGLSIFIGKGIIHYQWAQYPAAVSAKAPGTDKEAVAMYRMDVALLGANKMAKTVTLQPQGYNETYYMPQLITSPVKAAAYGRVVYKDIYPNVDWLLYFNDAGRLEYDFVVHPGGRVEDIRLQFGGASSLQLDKTGGLEARTPFGYIREHAPVGIQEDGKNIATRFVIHNNILGFQADRYTGKLIIDPVVEWGTYYGGAGDEQGLSVTADTSGYIYMTGFTKSATNIATTGAYDTSYSPSQDAFLVKFDSAGTRLWATYYGGTGIDFGWAATCNKAGAVYVAGYTQSAGLATVGAHQDTLAGNLEAFLVKFDTDGNRLWHTYYGGTADDLGQSVTCDDSGYVYLSGHTKSLNGIATANGYKTSFGGNQDAFLVKFNDNGVRQWGTYFGGTYADYGYDVTCDPAGSVYMCGRTSSISDIASPGSHLSTYYGTIMFGFNFGYVGYLAKFNKEGAHQWGTYYSAQTSEATSVASDLSYNIYLAGRTMKDSQYVATAGSHQDTMGSFGDLYGDAFLAKFDSAGVRQWGTYYGGSRDEEYLSVTCNLSGNIYLAGRTSSPDMIATPGAPLTQLNDSCTGGGCLPDAFLAKFNADGERQWGTYYGTKRYDHFGSVTTDGYGGVFTSGFSNSITDIATTGSHQATLGGALDAVLVKFYDCPASPSLPDNITGDDTVCINSVQEYLTATVPGVTHTWTLPAGWLGSDTEGDTIQVTAPSASGTGIFKVKALAQCERRMLESDERTLSVYVPPFNEAVINVNGFILGTTSTYATWQWYFNGTAIAGATGSTYTVTQNGDYTVAVTDLYGCTDSSDVYTVTNTNSITEKGIGRLISIYPNPSSDLVYIKAPVKVNATISSIEGKVVRQVDHANTFSVAGLAPGIYLLRITATDGTLLKVTKLTRQ